MGLLFSPQTLNIKKIMKCPVCGCEDLKDYIIEEIFVDCPCCGTHLVVNSMEEAVGYVTSDGVICCFS